MKTGYNRKTKTAFGIFSILLFLFSVSITPLASQANNSGNVTFENESIVISITGGENVPKYSFWSPEDNVSMYQVQFLRMFEVNDSNGNGIYDMGSESSVPLSTKALASVQWAFTDVVESDSTTDFNISSTNQDFTLEFRNHVGNDASSLKFDIAISDYEFTSSSDNALLVLGFRLNSNDDTYSDEENSINFGVNGFFEIVDTASTDSGDINVGLSSDSEEGGPVVYISYERFDNSFVHDPEIGFIDGSISEKLFNIFNVLNISKDGYTISMTALTVLFTGLIIVSVKKRTK